MQQPKKLIEVAMPIKEISAESVRDKSIRHGHISTLHLWWARRPLPVCRAVVFASLVPDPLDENCPQSFKDAVKELLGQPFALATKPGYEEFKQDWYKPYTDIPYTAAHDLMEDNLRNRLLMFIGKYSDQFVENERKGKATNPKDQLSDASLIKWESRHNDTVIGIARKLIWVAHNASEGATSDQLISDFEEHYAGIKQAEQELYSTKDRHKLRDDVKRKEEKLHQAIEAFLNKMPKVFDPFAGGGAIPLEASRLGCRSFGNDINPVAHIIQKGSLEFPQKYGKPITYSKVEFEKIYGVERFKDLPGEWKKVEAGETSAVRIPNRLSFDVEFYAKKLLRLTENEIGYLYPSDEKGNKPIAYYWAYEGRCSNPSCKADVPLLRQFYLCNKPDKKIFLNPVIKGHAISFEITKGEYDGDDWIQRKNLKCPICGNLTDIDELKRQFNAKEPKPRMLAVIEEGKGSKNYRLPTKNEIEILKNIPEVKQRPFEKLPEGNNRDLHCMGWGVVYWADMFSNRQLVLMETLINKLNDLKNESEVNSKTDYGQSILCFLSILIDRIAAINTSFGRIHVGRETLETPFGRQAIPFMFDYPESNPFSGSSGSAINQLDWILRYIENECDHGFTVHCNNAASGDENQFSSKFLNCVVTDPPYYDAIAYADLSDFFYTWLKRTLGDVFQLNFARPQTPKLEECTALKHHHENSEQKAKEHFEEKLKHIFSTIETQTKEIVSIMFAHQSTEAWSTLCNSILSSRMNITGSWTMDTEMANRNIGLGGAALESSVTVSCKPSQRSGYSSYKDVKKSIESTVKLKVEELYRLGFRGADLLTACFGQAVSEFGKFEKVEKADGSEVLVPELLEMARESAFNALVKGFEADEFTKFYIAWAQLYGYTENDFDDVNRLVKIGLSIETNALFQEKLLLKNGNKQSLAGYQERVEERPNLGIELNDPIIDQTHKGMYYFKKNDRKALLQHIAQVANSPESLFWRVINSLVEILPLDKDHDDKKIATELLASKDNLIRDSKQVPTTTSQTTLGL